MTILETDRLIVRCPSPTADLPALLAIFGDSANMLHFGAEQEIRQFLSGYPDGDPHLVSRPGLVLLKPHLEPVGFGGVGYYGAAGMALCFAPAAGG
jgi:hypothetical protein